jgi:hypothetical protein
MKMKYALFTLIILSMLSGCTMDRSEVIAAVKECEDAGYKAKVVYGFPVKPIEVLCVHE